MPKRRQVGGMQEVLVQLSAKTVQGMNRSIQAIESRCGRVLYAFPPSSIVASVAAEDISKLVGTAGIVSADTGPAGAKRLKSASGELSDALAAWNHHVNSERRALAMASPELNRAWDAADHLPPDPPRTVQEYLRHREEELRPRGMATPEFAGAPLTNIPVLVGRVGVGLVFVDSTVSEYQITDSMKAKVVSETAEGLNMLSGFEPRAKIQWFYDIKRPQISVPASQFPSSNQNDWEDTWRNAAMSALGYTANLTGLQDYIKAVKNAMNAQWAFAIFVTKYPIFWFAYEWANHVVMDLKVDGWGIDNFNLVVAHETGHVFGCPDEYASSGCNCTSLAGRYQVPNGNCENCASPSVPCLMSHNAQAVCDYTRGHLGWNELAVQSEGTTTLKGTWTFDFDNGVQGPATGADLWWEQVNKVTRYLVPQSGAMLDCMGKINFDAVSLQTLRTRPYTATPLNGSNNASNQIVPGTVIAIKTSAGRHAKMKINSYGYNLGISWVTYK